MSQNKSAYVIKRTGELLEALEGLNPVVCDEPLPTVSVNIGGRKLFVVLDEPYQVGQKLVEFAYITLKYRFEDDGDFLYCSANEVKEEIESLKEYVDLVNVSTPVKIEKEQSSFEKLDNKPVTVQVVEEPVVEESVPEFDEDDDDDDEPCNCEFCKDLDEEEAEEDLFAEIPNKDEIIALLTTLSDDAKNAFRDIIVNPSKIKYPDDYPSLTDDMFTVLYQLVFLEQETALKIIDLQF